MNTAAVKLGVSIEVGSQTATQSRAGLGDVNPGVARVWRPSIVGRFNPENACETHVEGQSNSLRRGAAACQIGENPGGAYNPLFIYGGVEICKTHLMQAVGVQMLTCRPEANIAYVHSSALSPTWSRHYNTTPSMNSKFYRGLMPC